MTYKYIEHNLDRSIVSFEISMNLYRDPTGIDFDNYATFGIFQKHSTGSWSSHEVISNVPKGPVLSIEPDTDQCRTRFLNDDKLEYSTYLFRIDLPVSDQPYNVSYQRGFRNYTINNVLSDGTLGAIYDIEISPLAQRLGNNSPVFDAVPPIFLCNQFPVNVDHSATDPDGDYIIYRFCEPYSRSNFQVGGTNCCGCANPDAIMCTPPFRELNYIVPYTSQIPMSGNPTVSINSSDGFITGLPDISGAYVVAICAEEYRGGELMSTIRRDYEFNVISCIDNYIAMIEADSFFIDNVTNNYTAYYESCNELTFDLTNISTDESFINYYKWDFYDALDNQVSTETGSDLRNYTIEFPTAGEYTGHMIIGNNLLCPDTAHMQFYISPKITADFVYSYDSCVAGPVLYENNSLPINTITEWLWDLGEGSFSNDQFPPVVSYSDRGNYSVSLSVTDDHGCVDSISKDITWWPLQLQAPDTIELTNEICYNDSLYIYDGWKYEPGEYLNFIPNSFNDCDSIVERILLSKTDVIPLTDLSVYICPGATLEYNGSMYSEQDTYVISLESNQGCDSIIALELKFYDTSTTQLLDTICPSEVILFNQIIIDAAGTYTDTLINHNGCDSIIQLNVVPLNNKSNNIEVSLCPDIGYNFNDIILYETGMYIDTLQSTAGCDSIIY